MRLITKVEMVQGMLDHPYDTNPALLAKVNFFYTSPDKKLTMAYYESPVGWHDVVVKGFEEIDYVLEGEVQLVSDTETILAKAGDAFLIEEGDVFRWHMLSPSKMIFFIYPLTSELAEVIESFYDRT
jgi:ethanolamine utilization protein EutQ (cupin superfamily)